MIYKLLKSTTVKLLLLVCTVLSTLILSSFLFNNQIDMLKKQIDNIYFANLIPIVKLQIIADNYKDIVSCRKVKYICDFKNEQEIILQEWLYYNNTYKSNDERIVVDTINNEILNSFKENKLHLFQNVLTRINFLIKYETQLAFKQRKSFVEDYDKMKIYLSYSVVFIIFISTFIIFYIVIQVIRKDKQVTVLNKKYKID